MRKVAYKQRKEVERFLRRIKEFRRIAIRYEKLDAAFITRLVLALSLLCCKTGVKHALAEPANCREKSDWV